MRWEILSKDNKDIIKTLLKNRGIKNQTDFFNPTDPYTIKLSELGVKTPETKKAVDRIKKAKKNNEQVIVYGDYDADGITATAIMWEALHGLGLDVLPHIPDRFEEGYGINAKSVNNLKLKIQNLKLIVTVDNGIVGYDGIKRANDLGIDVIVIDHHTKGEKKNYAFSIIHSTLTSGSALTWFFAKELGFKSGLELAAIGTIADQLPLVGINRSVVKFGLEELNKTKRVGLLELFNESGIAVSGKVVKEIGTYEVNYIIAPRINAMGRLKNGIESLRLLCTKDFRKAREIAKNISATNSERQKMVDIILVKAMEISKNNKNKLLVISDESFHEGIIGLAAGKLVEQFYRPAIVLSKKGDKAKASARSISGFNIIEAIRATEMILEGGGHPMAAGFSIETAKIDDFDKKINKVAEKLITDDLLEKKLKIDCEINFEEINPQLASAILQFEPFGLGNYEPLFCSSNVEVEDAKPVGREAKHLKLKLKQNGKVFDAIWFSPADPLSVKQSDKVSVAFSLEENVWNNQTSLQLKVRDIKV